MKHRSRNKYDTLLVWMYHNNKEHLLPDSLRNIVPHSTASAWRNMSFDYTGSECRHILNESLSWHELLHERNKLKNTLKTLAKSWICIENLLRPVLRKSK